MHIQVTDGVGVGPTELSAFDQALVKAGVANYNLIYLSSVLPPASEVEITNEPQPLAGDWGDRLYVVMAQQRASQPGSEAWAGIGWIQDPVTNKGLLVEHEGHSEDEVRSDITNSLQALADNRGMTFGPPQMHVSGVQCADKPVCALVVAVFESNAWETIGAKSTSAPKQLTAAPLS